MKFFGVSQRMVRLVHDPGHFYSPIVNPAELTDRQDELWPANPEMLGVDCNDASHLQVLEQWFPQFIGDYDYPETSTSSDAELKQFYTQNSQFSWLDSRALFVLLRAWRPRRLIEVGSGYSSMLIADVNRRFLDGSLNITCIEPYPRPFLKNPEMGIDRLLVAKVQEVPMAEFAALEAGDVLFIDSSHVAKTGSDITHLFLKVLPHLQPGVRVHVHDIFLPNEYPKDWVLDENRSWNEQYFLQALLMYSNRYRMVFGCSYAFARYPEQVRMALAHPKGHAFAGGSFWFEVMGDSPR